MRPHGTEEAEGYV